DSVLQTIMPLHDRFGPLERGLADMWAAVLRGDMVGQYNAGRAMLAAAPGSEVALYTAGIKAIEVNRPEEAIGFLRRIRVERSAVLWDIYGTQLPSALHWARRYRDELAETERRRKRQPALLRAMQEQARALVALGRIAEAKRVVDEMFALPADTSLLLSIPVYA